MRDSNYKSVSLNKAAVSITTSLYDRRALDATCDRPLVNSLNHLTFLTSSSAKVRETLATDGGLERLVCILHECRKEAIRSKAGPKTIAEEKQDALIAWKWTLAFQCLVLIGTRGTEKIRERVVQAGVVPIIATVLDNYLLASRNFDASTDSSLGESFVSLVQGRVLKSEKNQKSKTEDVDDEEDDDGEVITSYLSANSELLQYLNKNKSTTPSSAVSPEAIPENIPSITELNIQQNLHDINHTITSPRFFLRGVLIPKEDDVVWSLQLLAFISKYSNLKKHLQCSHLVEHLSLRALLQGDDNSAEGEMRPPALETDDADNDAEMELLSNLSSDESEQQSQTTSRQQHQRLIHSQSSQVEPSTQQSSAGTPGVLIQVNNSNEEINNQQEGKSAELIPDLNAHLISPDGPVTPKKTTLEEAKTKCCLTKSLLNSLMKFECCSKNNAQSHEEKTFSLIELTIKLNSFYAEKFIISRLNKINKAKKQREEYNAKWNYDTYFQNYPADADRDLSTSTKHELNIFPLVEKFTVKANNSTDMCYWSGVIMRNSCRKAESGVRQCACFDCGRWEKYPREFAKCRRCKRTKYCSKQCQLRAWCYHKHWCLDSGSAGSSSQSQSQSQQETQPASRDEIRLAEL